MTGDNNDDNKGLKPSDFKLESAKLIYTWLFVLNAGALLAILTSIVSKECHLPSHSPFIVAAIVCGLGIFCLFLSLGILYHKSNKSLDTNKGEKEDYFWPEALTLISSLLLVAGLISVFYGVFQSSKHPQCIEDKGEIKESVSHRFQFKGGGNYW